jgi:hypothetical protein
MFLALSLSLLAMTAQFVQARADQLRELSTQLERCSNDAKNESRGNGDICTGVIYLWSASMPLSEAGLAEVRRGAAGLTYVAIVSASDVVARLKDVPHKSTPDPELELARSIAAAGGLAHFPAVIVFRNGVAIGPAILGYKEAQTYRVLLAGRLGLQAAPSRPRPERIDQLMKAPMMGRIVRDINIEGEPGAYFRFAPNHGSVALTREQRVDFLDIDSGRFSPAPGYIDFIPSPDGRLFVTPTRLRGGLSFFDQSQLFERRDPSTAEPRLVDKLMRDQYPSIGLLSERRVGRSVESTYRVLTSWTERAMFRDYLVKSTEAGTTDIKPISNPLVACPTLKISIPMLSRSGRELAARDEGTGTTKLFELADDGECKESLDLGLPTGKIAWSPNGDRIAFSISNGAVRDSFGYRLPESQMVPGVFVLHRSKRMLAKIAGSENLDHLVFPDFIDADHLIFLVRVEKSASILRIVCCFS